MLHETAQLRVHHPEIREATLVYLPGLHGDWTLLAGFRQALGNRVRLVEITYPRTRTWSLEEYAAGIETALAQAGIDRGWLLGESFGSQVLWALVRRRRFTVEGAILAGGFARHPMLWGVHFAWWCLRVVPAALVRPILRIYAGVARVRFRHSPEVLAGVAEFVSRRTNADRLAALHRLRLIAHNDPRPVVQQLQVPLFLLAGAVDPIVPWCRLHGWFRRNCPTLRGRRIVWHADHNVLGTGPKAAARQISQWICTPASPRPARD